MDPVTATLILGGLRFFNDIYNNSTEPIVNKDGKVIAGNIREFEMKSGEGIFKKHFDGKSMEEIKKEVEGL